jgi:PKD repeat protein
VLVPIVLVAGLVATVPSKGGSAPSSGLTSAISVTISDRIVCAPAAGPVSVLYSCPTGLAWRFSAAATGGVPPYVFLWSFGDGSLPASGQTVVHTFPDCDLHTVTVVAIDLAGAGSNSTIVRGCAPA